MGENIKKYNIIVEGMSCGHCKDAVEKAVGALPGILSVKVDLVAKTLIGEVDTSKTTVTQIKEAVDEEGFTAV